MRFYSEHEFDLERIKRLDGELLELGRTCARKDFRDEALIPLMWGTIVEALVTIQPKIECLRYEDNSAGR